MPEPQSTSRPENDAAHPVRWGAVASLAAVLGLRMLGLFMVLPVLALHVADMPGATPLAAGLALGIYGLTQAVFQVPFGRLSDRWGRKPVIVGGLLLFGIGSAVAAVAQSPGLLILGRAMQGAGAISAAVIALVGDLTPLHRRTRAMALIGIVIGMAFILAFVLGPLLAGWLGIAGLFWLGLAFALGGVALVAPLRVPPGSTERALPLRDVLLPVAPYAAGIFLLHAIMTATFLAVPVMLSEAYAIPASQHGWVYLPVMLGSLLVLAPLILLQERHAPRAALVLAVLGLLAGQAGMASLHDATAFHVALALFFGGFNFVEAQFPAVVSRLTGAEGRGSALGVYATAQFLGAFAGGLTGGWVSAEGGIGSVLLVNTVFAAGWLLLLVFRRISSSAGPGESA